MSITANAEAAALYVVATPIGNLGDISHRAVEVLGTVGLIAAEDTRHSRRLLDHLGIRTRMVACHEHNEAESAAGLLETLQTGTAVALISDAGTPLISDPGYRLLELAHRNGIRVVPVPGPCAAIAALSIAGLPTDRFVFEGFLPAKHQARLRALEALRHETRSIVCYESCHRIADTLADMCDVLEPDRVVTFTRELTKSFETVRRTTLGECLDWVRGDPRQRKGEIVLVLAGAAAPAGSSLELQQVLRILLAELPLKQAAKLAAAITGEHRNHCYQLALELRDAD